MQRRVFAGMIVAVTVTACGASGTAVPKTPAITAARACLHRDGMIVSRIPAAQLRSFSSEPETTPLPVAGLTVIKRGRRGSPRTRILVAYFATPAAATASNNAGLTALLSEGSFEVQQAASRSHHGRVLLLDYRGADLTTELKVRHCTMGVPASPFAS
jgi:hypothetical protein